MVCFLMVASIEVTPHTQKEKIPVALFSSNEMRRPGMIRKTCEAVFRKDHPKQEDWRDMFAMRNLRRLSSCAQAL
jgi:hypothetical protein